MTSSLPRSLFLLAVLALVAFSPADDARFDLVLAEGRVMDPESGLDGVRWVGIRGGQIAAVSETPLDAAVILDASGHVIAPGFIDTHAHGQNDANYRLFAMNGVTTALEMEVGTGDVEAWYGARAGGTLIHHGASIGHIPMRDGVVVENTRPGRGLRGGR
jgi:cytosine/adenosine deaminase-related metal-dependent hydrolase